MILSPDTPSSGDEKWLLFRVPLESGHARLFVGALAVLTDEWNFIREGSQSPHETAEEFSRILSEMIYYQPPEVGTFIPSIRANPPANWIPCYGGDLAMADWPELMEVYPSVLKNYPSTGRFVVPDMRGRTFVGDGTDGTGFNWPFLSIGGARQHTLTENEMPVHAHSYLPPTPNIDLEAPGVPDIIAAGVGVPTNTGNAGGGAAHNNMPPYGVVKIYLVGRLVP